MVKAYLVLTPEPRKQKRRARYGPIVIRDGQAWLNVVDGRASRQRPVELVRRGRFPKPWPCSVCGAIFEAQSGNAAYCSKDCHEQKACRAPHRRRDGGGASEPEATAGCAEAMSMMCRRFLEVFC